MLAVWRPRTTSPRHPGAAERPPDRYMPRTATQAPEKGLLAAARRKDQIRYRAECPGEYEQQESLIKNRRASGGFVAALHDGGSLTEEEECVREEEVLHRWRREEQGWSRCFSRVFTPVADGLGGAGTLLLLAPRGLRGRYAAGTLSRCSGWYWPLWMAPARPAFPLP